MSQRQAWGQAHWHGRLAILLAATATLCALSPAQSQPQTPAGPTLAVEDTMFTELPEVLVSAPRVTLNEILDRVHAGEVRRESLMVDQAFTLSVRALKDVGRKNKPPVVMIETVQRVFRKRPDKFRAVTVREYFSKGAGEEGNDEIGAEFSAYMGEEIVNFAFRPEARRDYRYAIESRSIIGNRLVYKIKFEPKSSLDFENPSGRVWVDTNEFVIVRQELIFDRSPVPLFLKGLPRAVIERQNVDGHWVLHRVLMRIEMAIPIPKWGRHFDMVVNYGDYTINGGLDDELFSGDPLHLRVAP